MGGEWQSSAAKCLQQATTDERQLQDIALAILDIAVTLTSLITLQKSLSVLLPIFKRQFDVQLGQQRIGFLFFVVHDRIENL